MTFPTTGIRIIIRKKRLSAKRNSFKNTIARDADNSIPFEQTN
jgi:hypothetical protein